MTDLAALRDRLLALRRKTLDLLAERSEEAVADAGLIGLIADVQIVIGVIDLETAKALNADQFPGPPLHEVSK